MEYECGECGIKRSMLSPNEKDWMAIIELEENGVYSRNLGRNLVLSLHQDETKIRTWKEQEELCQKCFYQYKWEVAPGPICCNCHYEYPWTCGQDQGSCCAAWIGHSKDYVYASYGSVFDEDRYHFNPKQPPAGIELKAQAPVCDLCIIQWLQDDTLQSRKNDDSVDTWLLWMARLWRLWKKVHQEMSEHLGKQLKSQLPMCLSIYDKIIAQFVF